MSVNETGSFHVHIEVLLGAPGLEVVDLILLVVETGLLFSLLLLLSLEVELLVVLGDVVKNIALGLALFILQHASHAVQFLSLLGILLVFESLLLLALTLLFDLLVEPLLLLILEEFFTGIIL